MKKAEKKIRSEYDFIGGVRGKHHKMMQEGYCLAVASQRNWKIATDDRDARQWAVRLRIPYTGTLGILAALVKQKRIRLAEGNEWLLWMMQAGYHSPVNQLDDLVRGST